MSGEQCSDLASIADRKLRCSLAKKVCDAESLLPYATLIFCYLSNTILRIALLTLFILLDFAAMGVAAFDYLGPNLTRLAESSGFSESLMGVTVLAFGNGSVDVFGAFVALNRGEGGMAFGEIMGGALFVCSVVVGSMAIVQPFEIYFRCLVRDVVVLCTAIVYTVYIVHDGVIELAEALIGISMYVAYAALVVHEHWSCNEKSIDDADEGMPQTPQIERSQSPFNEGVSPCHSSEQPLFTPLRPSLYSAFDMSSKVQTQLEELAPRESSPFCEVYERSSRDPLAGSDANGSQVYISPGTEYSMPPPSAPSSAVSTAPNSGLLTPHDLPKINTSFANVTNGSKTLLPANSMATPILRVTSDEAGFDITDEQHLHDNRHRHHHHHHHHHHNTAFTNNHILPWPSHSSGSSAGGAQSLRRFSDHSSPELLQTPHLHGHKDFTMKHFVNRVLESRREQAGLTPVLHPNAADSRRGSVLEPSGTTDTESTCPSFASSDQLCADVELPWWLYLFPSLTEWPEAAWLRRLTISVTLPIISPLSWSIPLPSRAHDRKRIYIYAFGIPIIFPIIAPNISVRPTTILFQLLAIALGVIWWGKLQKPLPPVGLLAVVGFIMAILWVLCIATELVSVLTTLGAVCHVSNTMLGLTVFALGDSLGDFVSNITVARIGYPTMAISACFGGPIFTLLVGVSGASLFTMLNNRTTQLEVPAQSSLLISGLGLLTILLWFAVTVYKNNYMVTKQIGIVLICMWMTVVSCSILYSHQL